MKEELYRQILSMDLRQLKDYSSHWLYASLSGICQVKNQDITVENMLLHAPELDTELDEQYSGDEQIVNYTEDEDSALLDHWL